MPRLVDFQFIDNHIHGKLEIIRPFVEQVLAHQEVWEKFIASDSQQKNVLETLRKLLQTINSLSEVELTKKNINKSIIIQWLNSLIDYSVYYRYDNRVNQFNMYECKLDDGKKYFINCQQVLAVIYELLTRKFLVGTLEQNELAAAEVIADAIQPQTEKDTTCPTGRAYSAILFYNLALSNPLTVFEPLTEDQAKQMFDVLVERSQTFFGGIVPEPADDITVDDTDPHKTLFSIQDAKKHDYVISHTKIFGELASLRTTNSPTYLQLSQKYFHTNIFAWLFSAIVIRTQNAYHPLTMHSIIGSLSEIGEKFPMEEVDSVLAHIKQEVIILLLKEKYFLQRQFSSTTTKELGIILLAEAIVYAGLSRNIREFLNRISDEEKKKFFGLEDDNDLLTANALAEDLRLLNVRLYEVIPTLLNIPDGSIKVMGDGIGLLSSENNGYKKNSALRSSKEFLQICWALFNESISDANANRARMLGLKLECDDKGGSITLGEIMSDYDPDSHFGNLSVENIRNASLLLQKFRMWILYGKSGKCPCDLNDSEISSLEQWGAATLDKESQLVQLGQKELKERMELESLYAEELRRLHELKHTEQQLIQLGPTESEERMELENSYAEELKRLRELQHKEQPLIQLGQTELEERMKLESSYAEEPRRLYELKHKEQQLIQLGQTELKERMEL